MITRYLVITAFVILVFAAMMVFNKFGDTIEQTISEAPSASRKIAKSQTAEGSSHKLSNSQYTETKTEPSESKLDPAGIKIGQDNNPEFFRWLRENHNAVTQQFALIFIRSDAGEPRKAAILETLLENDLYSDLDREWFDVITDILIRDDVSETYAFKLSRILSKVSSGQNSMQEQLLSMLGSASNAASNAALVAAVESPERLRELAGFEADSIEDNNSLVTNVARERYVEHADSAELLKLLPSLSSESQAKEWAVAAIAKSAKTSDSFQENFRAVIASAKDPEGQIQIEENFLMATAQSNMLGRTEVLLKQLYAYLALLKSTTWPSTQRL